jgi:alpha/beta superfamily hydrolase
MALRKVRTIFCHLVKLGLFGFGSSISLQIALRHCKITHAEITFPEVTHTEIAFLKVSHAENEFIKASHAENAFLKVSHAENAFLTVLHAEITL